MQNKERKEPTVAEQNGILFQARQKYGLPGDTDSYKLSHHPQYPKDADMMISYFESRGGDSDVVINFGLQMLIKEYMLQRVTKEQAANMVEWARQHMNGNVTDDLEIALNRVVDELGGRLPLRIRNAPEGLLIPIKNVLFTIETTILGREWFSLVSYFETKLVRVWAPMTVATTSYNVRQVIKAALEKSSDNPEAVNFMFHDFGSRGTLGMEGSAFGGAGHLTSFYGTDTVIAVHAVEFAYNEPMAGFSIPATEHSTTTMHGRDGEPQLVAQMFDNYAKPGAIFATVIDSFDALAFIRYLAPMFKDRLIESGAKWVFRPDSGDAIRMPVKCVEELDKVFGHTVNSKGYKVLNNVGVIQGDGIAPPQVKEILDLLMSKGYSAENMAFGMGGGLLQKINRDTHKFALKCSAVRINGIWEDVYKDPTVYDHNFNKVDDVVSFKKSKKGRLELIRNVNTGEYKTVRLEEILSYGAQKEWEVMLETIYEDGYMMRDMTFEEVRRNTGMIS